MTVRALTPFLSRRVDRAVELALVLRRELEGSAERIGRHGELRLLYSIALIYKKEWCGKPSEQRGRSTKAQIGPVRKQQKDFGLCGGSEVGGVRCFGAGSLSHLAGATPSGSRPLKGHPLSIRPVVASARPPRCGLGTLNVSDFGDQLTPL